MPERPVPAMQAATQARRANEDREYQNRPIGRIGFAIDCVLAKTGTVFAKAFRENARDLRAAPRRVATIIGIGMSPCMN